MILQEFRVLPFLGTNGSLITDIHGDGIENLTLIGCQAGSVRACVPAGNVNFLGGGPYNLMALLGQAINLWGTTVGGPGVASTITLTNNNVQGATMIWGGVAFPCVLNLDNAYFNGNSGSVHIQNNNSKGPTVINYKGGFDLMIGSPAAFIKGNEAATVINLFGGTTFKSAGNVPLVSVAPLGCFIGGRISLLGAITAAQFLANTHYASNATNVVAGFSNPVIVAEKNASRQTTIQSLLFKPPPVAGSYRAHFYVNVTTSGSSTIPKIAFTDEAGTAVSAIAVPMIALGGTVVLASLTATGHYSGVVDFDVNDAGETVVLTITPNGSMFGYDMWIERIR